MTYNDWNNNDERDDFDDFMDYEMSDYPARGNVHDGNDFKIQSDASGCAWIFWLVAIIFVIFILAK